ncbi:unnamed protein product [Leptidea sinapis]|uniref:Uncharacterized protein n=1 Tax=Leptidea sinapis TaxID=189913 RepID=A0A5E4PKL0_9NEOP|nr:unnamed protein product [Leptidea sinapis]
MLPPNETTTKVPLVCGEECNYLYTRVGAVCGRQINNKEYEQCITFFGWFCISGSWDEFHRTFKTFNTYCEFLDAQCKSSFQNRWIFVREGPCTHDYDKYFPLMGDTQKPYSRLVHYVTQLAQNFHNASLPVPQGYGPDHVYQRVGTARKNNQAASSSLFDKIRKTFFGNK